MKNKNAAILTLISLFILCGLGAWQLQRLQWKNGLQEDLAAARANASRLTAADLTEGTTFKHGTIRGQYLLGAAKDIRIAPRTNEGKKGAHLYSAFRLDDWHIVFVNRGWVPEDYKGDALPYGRRITLTGTFKKPDSSGLFTPENKPESQEWYHSDINAMATLLPEGNIILPYVFVLENDDRRAPPVTAATRVDYTNNHLHYALFWFTMAGILLVIYYLRFIRK